MTAVQDAPLEMDKVWPGDPGKASVHGTQHSAQILGHCVIWGSQRHPWAVDPGHDPPHQTTAELQCPESQSVGLVLTVHSGHIFNASPGGAPMDSERNADPEQSARPLVGRGDSLPVPAPCPSPRTRRLRQKEVELVFTTLATQRRRKQI